LWDYHAISSFEKLKANQNLDKNDVIAIKMIEKFDLMVCCRSTFYDSQVCDLDARNKIITYFKDAFNTPIYENNRINKYEGFDQYVYQMSRICNILTVRRLLTLKHDDKQDFEIINGFRKRGYDMYVSYIWKKGFSDKISFVTDLNSCTESGML
jgi:hypothetical protein